MNTAFNQYKTLIITLIRQKRLKTVSKGTTKKSKTAATYLGMGIALVAFAFYFVIYAINITVAGAQIGAHKEALGAIIGLSQLIILFFGLIAAMSYLYFSKDNELLSSLPIKQDVVFWAKFTMTYLSELLLCLFFAIPTTIAYGVISSSGLGIAIPWHYYVAVILSSFTLPIIPLLFVSVLSIPLMYIVSYVKKRKMLSNLIGAFLFVAVMGLYFVAVGSISGGTKTDEEGNIIVSNAIANMIHGLNNTMFFNKPLVNALYGDKVFVNYLLYIVTVLGSGVIAGIVSSLFYKRVLLTSNDGMKNSGKSKKGKIETSNFIKSYTKKEILSLTSNSSLFINTIMMLVMPIIILVFFSFSMGSEDGNFSIFIVGMMSYMYTIMLCSNPIVAIGFSREGKNLAVLKSLPISIGDLIKVKMMIGIILNSVTCLIAVILLPILVKTRFYAGLMVGIVSFLTAYGIGCISLNRDLEKPNLKWQNFNELTKNNKTTMLPMMISLGVGFLNIIIGSVLAFVPWNVSMDIKLLVYFAICLIPAVLIAVLGRKRLYKDAEEKFYRIET